MGGLDSFNYHVIYVTYDSIGIVRLFGYKTTELEYKDLASSNEWYINVVKDSAYYPWILGSIQSNTNYSKNVTRTLPAGITMREVNSTYARVYYTTSASSGCLLTKFL